MRKQILGLLIVPVAILAGVAACGDDDDNGTTPGTDGGTDSAAADGSSDVDSGTGSKDGGADSSTPQPFPQLTFQTLVQFNGKAFEAPEGLAALASDAGFGTPLASYTPKGIVAEALPDGGYENYAPQVPGWVPQKPKTMGLTTDSTGATYVGVGSLDSNAAADVVPAVGIYKIAAKGDTPVLHSKAVTPPMQWPAGLDVIGTDVYSADSDGRIYKVTADGTTTVWSADALLAGNKSACPAATLQTPRPFGASWLTHDANAIYVSNFDHGALIKIPINGGAAGTPELIIKGLLGGGTDCSYQSMRGVVVDKDGTFFFATPLNNSVWHASADGKTVTKVATGKPPFDQPSGLFIDTNGATGARRLLVTNFAIQAIQADAGPTPGIVFAELP